VTCRPIQPPPWRTGIGRTRGCTQRRSPRGSAGPNVPCAVTGHLSPRPAGGQLSGHAVAEIRSGQRCARADADLGSGHRRPGGDRPDLANPPRPHGHRGGPAAAAPTLRPGPAGHHRPHRADRTQPPRHRRPHRTRRVPGEQKTVRRAVDKPDAHWRTLRGTGDQPDSRADGGSWLSLSDSVGVGEHVDGEAGVRRHQVGLGLERDHLAVPADRRVLAAE
jgi:hypothetical protein